MDERRYLVRKFRARFSLGIDRVIAKKASDHGAPTRLHGQVSLALMYGESMEN
jgi:hypothetical protein